MKSGHRPIYLYHEFESQQIASQIIVADTLNVCAGGTNDRMTSYRGKGGLV